MSRAKYMAVCAAAVELVIGDDDAAGEMLSESVLALAFGDEAPPDAADMAAHGLTAPERRVVMAAWERVAGAESDELDRAVLAMGPECECGGHQSEGHVCVEESGR
jgi:hypothetical protein